MMGVYALPQFSELSMSDSSRQLPRHAQGSMHVMGDRVMLAAIVISAITAVALGFNFV